MTCDRCGAPVIHAELLQEGPGVLGGRVIVLDSEPDSERGTVILQDNKCRFVEGAEKWKLVRDYGIPVYTRHNIRCGGFWPR